MGGRFRCQRSMAPGFASRIACPLWFRRCSNRLPGVRARGCRERLRKPRPAGLRGVLRRLGGSCPPQVAANLVKAVVAGKLAYVQDRRRRVKLAPLAPLSGYLQRAAAPLLLAPKEFVLACQIHACPWPPVPCLDAGHA